jgi:hypothetical protein
LIYVVGVPHSVSAPVKIGSSANVPQRLVQLQRGESMPLRVATMIPDPADLDVLASFDGDETAERRLHAVFRDRRVGGEWFYLGGPVVAVERVTAAFEQGATPISHQTPVPPTTLATEAVRHHEMFLSWVAAGFTEDQALRLLAHSIQGDATRR